MKVHNSVITVVQDPVAASQAMTSIATSHGTGATTTKTGVLVCTYWSTPSNQHTEAQNSHLQKCSSWLYLFHHPGDFRAAENSLSVQVKRHEGEIYNQNIIMYVDFCYLHFPVTTKEGSLTMTKLSEYCSYH